MRHLERKHRPFFEDMNLATAFRHKLGKFGADEPTPDDGDSFAHRHVGLRRLTKLRRTVRDTGKAPSAHCEPRRERELCLRLG